MYITPQRLFQSWEHDKLAAKPIYGLCYNYPLGVRKENILTVLVSRTRFWQKLLASKRPIIGYEQ